MGLPSGGERLWTREGGLNAPLASITFTSYGVVDWIVFAFRREVFGIHLVVVGNSGILP